MATVSSTPRTQTITLAAASAGPFDISIRLFSDDLRVTVNDELTTAFTVNSTYADGFDDNATITFNETLEIGDVILIESVLPAARDDDYEEGQPGLIAAINIEFGRIWSMLGDLRRDVGTAITLATGAAASAIEAAASALSASNSASVALTRSDITLGSVATMATRLVYSGETGNQIAAPVGAIVILPGGGRFEVLATDATVFDLDYTGAGGVKLGLVNGPRFGVRNDFNANELRQYPDSTVGHIAGFEYITDSSLNLTNSATGDINVTGLAPHGIEYAEHYGDLTGDVGVVFNRMYQAINVVRWLTIGTLNCDTQVVLDGTLFVVQGPSKSQCFLRHGSSLVDQAMFVLSAVGDRPRFFEIGGFSVEGAAPGQLTVGTMAFDIDHVLHGNLDVDIFRYQRADQTGRAYLITGGDIDSAEYSYQMRFTGDIDSCDDGLINGSRTDPLRDGPVNTSYWDHLRIGRSAAGGFSGTGFDNQRGFPTCLVAPNIEGFQDAINLNHFGFNMFGGDIENNENAFSIGPDLVQSTFVLPEVDVFGTYIVDHVPQEPEFPLNLLVHNGIINSMHAKLSARNCVLNGDFYLGAKGLGNWNSNIIHDPANSLFPHGWVHQINAAIDPGGAFVFDEATFKPNTMFTLVVRAKSTATANAGFRARVGGGDTGYTSGKSNLSGIALKLGGNRDISPQLRPSNAMEADGTWRFYTHTFFTGSNTDWPTGLEIYTPSAPTGGETYIGAVGVFEGTGALEFNLSHADMRGSRGAASALTNPTALEPITSNTTLSRYGGIAECDASAGAFTVTLPPADDTGRGARWTIVKTETSANRVNVGPTSGDQINGAIGIHDPSFFDGAVKSKTFVSNGVDGWWVESGY